MNQNASTMAFLLRDFTRMNPLMLLRSKGSEDLQDFLDEVYQILYVMRVDSPNEKTELSAYQLKDVAQTLYTQWRENRDLSADHIS